MRASRFVFPLVTFIRGVNLKSNLRFASLTWFALALLLLPARPAQAPRTGPRRSNWNKNFDLHKAPKIWQAAK